MSVPKLLEEAVTLLKDIKEEDKQIKTTLGKIIKKQEALDRVLASLVSQPTGTPKQTPSPEAEPDYGLSEKDLALVNIIIDAEGRGTVIKPKRYLGEAWHPMNDHLRSKGFEWVSAGKNSHWIKRSGDNV